MITDILCREGRLELESSLLAATRCHQLDPSSSPACFLQLGCQGSQREDLLLRRSRVWRRCRLVDRPPCHLLCWPSCLQLAQGWADAVRPSRTIGFQSPERNLGCRCHLVNSDGGIGTKRAAEASRRYHGPNRDHRHQVQGRRLGLGIGITGNNLVATSF